MIKVIVRSLRLVKSLIPSVLVDRLKQSDYLLNSYKRILRKGGVIGHLVDWRSQAAVYKEVIDRQNEELTGLGKPTEKYHVCMFVDTSAQAVKSLEKLEASTKDFESICFIGKDDSKIIKEVSKNIGKHNLTVLSKEQVLKSKGRVLLLNAGESLHTRALHCFDAHPNEAADVFYCDVDFTDKNANRVLPQLFPSWDPILQITTGYLSTGLVLVSDNAKSSLLKSQAKSVREFVNRVCLNLVVSHVNKVLVHKCQKQLSEFLKAPRANYQDLNIDCLPWVASSEFSTNKQPLVSLIIPTRNGVEILKNCVSSILNKSTYRNVEIIVVDNDSDDPETLNYLEQISALVNVQVVPYPHAFNYSAINNYALQFCSGEVIGLVNNDIEVISPDWLERMVELVILENVGCVGAKLLYPNRLIQHAGVVLGYGGGAGHAHKYFFSDGEGFLGRLSQTNCYSAVTAACLLVKRRDYLAVGGLNETDLTVAFNDVDFCLKVRELGKNNVYCAAAELFHHESISRGLDTSPEKRMRFEKELAYLQERWASYIANDPCYNSELSLLSENFVLKSNQEIANNQS